MLNIVTGARVDLNSPEVGIFLDQDDPIDDDDDEDVLEAILVTDPDRPRSHSHRGQVLVIGPNEYANWIAESRIDGRQERRAEPSIYQVATHREQYRRWDAKPLSGNFDIDQTAPIDLFFLREPQAILLHEVSLILEDCRLSIFLLTPIAAVS